MSTKHLNEVHLIGLLQETPYPPKIRHIGASNKAVADFTVITDIDNHKGYWPCTAWEGVADQVETLAGSMVEVFGRLAFETWVDKKTGEKKSKTKITAASVKQLKAKPKVADREPGSDDDVAF